MGRSIVIEFAGPDERFRVELLGDAAPRTCDAVWSALPITTQEGRHPMYSGLGMYAVLDFELREVENPHVMASGPGDVLFHSNPNDSWVYDRFPHPCELYVAYGPLRVSDWAGETPMNKFGRIVEGDLDLLARIGRRFREQGLQQMTISRGTGGEA
jgi:hypothetical protein